MIVCGMSRPVTTKKIENQKKRGFRKFYTKLNCPAKNFGRIQ